MHIRSDRLTWRDIDGEIVALDLISSTYFTANATGSTILRALADGAEHEHLVKALVDAFEVDAEQATKDVDAFLELLDSHGLLER